MDEANQWTDLIRTARSRLTQCSIDGDLQIGDPVAETMLKDIDGHSHHFVLGCLMDRQIEATRAWRIPYVVGLRNNKKWDFASYEELNLDAIREIFTEERLHRYKKMAPIFYHGIQRIRKHYNGIAKNIWANEPSAAKIVRRFYEFDGVGQKIATMATNILHRTFKIPMKDICMIDISVDRRVLNFFIEKGLIRPEAKSDELIWLAREKCPDYPGLLDMVAWEGGAKRRKKN